METGKREELLRDGWVFGDAAAFLELSPEEAEIIELNLVKPIVARSRTHAAETGSNDSAEGVYSK